VRRQRQAGSVPHANIHCDPPTFGSTAFRNVPTVFAEVSVNDRYLPLADKQNGRQELRQIELEGMSPGRDPLSQGESGAPLTTSTELQMQAAASKIVLALPYKSLMTTMQLAGHQTAQPI
jgi:hypothetical protein